MRVASAYVGTDHSPIAHDKGGELFKNCRAWSLTSPLIRTQIRNNAIGTGTSSQ